MQLTKQAGVSLVEVLAAVVVLAVGVIGAAALQWQALRTAHEAGLRSDASRIAADLAEHMRAYAMRAPPDTGARAPGNELEHPFIGFAYDSSRDQERPAPSCYASQCSVQQFAAFQLHDTARRVREMLPQGRLLVCRDANPWNEAGQALSWNCHQGVEGAASVVVKIGWRSRGDTRLDGVLPMLALVAHP